MHADDMPTGRILGRREALRILGAAGGALLLPTGSPPAPRAPIACVVRPEQTVGPYFLDARLLRADIRTEPSTGVARPGVPLALAFVVQRVDGGRCAPLAGALVDVWQCDAQGVYSAFEDLDGRFDTRGESFLRGQQQTDAEGVARFVTIWPGWYEGRAVHVHFKIRAPGAGGSTWEFTSQLYFDEAANDRVLANAAYAKTGRRVRNAEDGPYRRNHGDQLVLTVHPDGPGFAGTFPIGLDLSDAATGRRDAWGA